MGEERVRGERRWRTSSTLKFDLNVCVHQVTGDDLRRENDSSVTQVSSLGFLPTARLFNFKAQHIRRTKNDC